MVLAEDKCVGADGDGLGAFCSICFCQVGTKGRSRHPMVTFDEGLHHLPVATWDFASHCEKSVRAVATERHSRTEGCGFFGERRRLLGVEGHQMPNPRIDLGQNQPFPCGTRHVPAFEESWKQARLDRARTGANFRPKHRIISSRTPQSLAPQPYISCRCHLKEAKSCRRLASIASFCLQFCVDECSTPCKA